MFVMDAYQYWVHRWMHTNRWLFKHFHSWHHRVYCPYAIGALYNHPVEVCVPLSLPLGAWCKPALSG